MTKHFLNLTRPKVLFINGTSASIAQEVAKKIGLDLKIVVFGTLSGQQSLDDILSTQENEQVCRFQCTKLSSVDDPAVIIYTSGTTGLPKGALHSHRSLFGNLDLASKLGHVQESVVTTMIFSSLSWVTGLLFMLRGAAYMERRVIYPEFSEEKTLQLVDKYKVSFMLLGPSAAVRLQRTPAIRNYNLTSLKYLYVGGAVMTEKVQKSLSETFPHTSILQLYGMLTLNTFIFKQFFITRTLWTLEKCFTSKVCSVFSCEYCPTLFWH